MVGISAFIKSKSGNKTPEGFSSFSMKDMFQFSIIVQSLGNVGATDPWPNEEKLIDKDVFVFRCLVSDVDFFTVSYLPVIEHSAHHIVRETTNTLASI